MLRASWLSHPASPSSIPKQVGVRGILLLDTLLPPTSQPLRSDPGPARTFDSKASAQATVRPPAAGCPSVPRHPGFRKGRRPSASTALPRRHRRVSYQVKGPMMSGRFRSKQEYCSGNGIRLLSVFLPVKQREMAGNGSERELKRTRRAGF